MYIRFFLKKNIKEIFEEYKGLLRRGRPEPS